MMKMTHAYGRWVGGPLLAAALLLLTGCGDLFDVSNPGSILDEDLNDPDLMSVLVTGLSAEMSDEIDWLAFDLATATDEMAGAGSYGQTGELRRGILDQDLVGFHWEQTHEARWTAELHIERMQEVIPEEFDDNPLVARTYVLMGTANRILGENFCQVAYTPADATPEEYSGPLPRDSAFKRAINAFQNALTHSDQATEFRHAAHGGLAQSYVGLGDWAKATQHSSQVPTSFEMVAFYDINDNDNDFWSETHDRHELSMFGTFAAEVNDPRAPFTMCGLMENGKVVQGPATCPTPVAAGGELAHWRQEKYDDVGSDIPLIKGTEMRLIEAEAALRSNDLATFTAKVNEVRAFYGADPISQPASAGKLEYPNAQDDAWSILDRERYLTMYIEGRRLWDLHRWDHPFLQGGRVVYEAEPVRDSCMPIPSSECRTNPNIPCGGIT